jgi:hypothetical protein
MPGASGFDLFDRTRVEGHVIFVTAINCEQALGFEPALNGGYEVHLRHLNAPLLMSRRFARRFRARFEL